MPQIRCTACESVEDIETVPVGYFCPACGAVEGFHVTVILEDTLTFHESLHTEGFDEDRKKFRDTRFGDDLFRLTGEWNDVTQIVGRRNNRYVKKIINSKGEVIRDEDGALTEHEPTAVKRRRESQRDG